MTVCIVSIMITKSKITWPLGSGFDQNLQDQIRTPTSMSWPPIRTTPSNHTKNFQNNRNNRCSGIFASQSAWYGCTSHYHHLIE
jgi:hypothetical protein